MKNLGQVTENQDIARKQDIPTNTNQLTNGAGFITSSAITNVVKTTTNNTFTANNIFKNNAFEIKANSSSDDSWIKLTNATDTGYYAFGIRRPYDMYGLQMKIHPDTGNDQYIDILHAGNYTKYAVPKTRTINSKALSSNISLTASDVGALPSSTTIPTALSQLSADATHRTVTDTEKATWNSKSSFSGSYTDLTNKPTIPTVNNGTLTIQKNGTNVATFTANQSTNATANITVPTKTSELTNDSGFITSADLPSGGVTSVVGKTGAVTASQLVTAMLTGAVGYGDKITATDFTTTDKNYIKYQSGLLIQWGFITLNATTTTINFKTPFKSNRYGIATLHSGGTITNGLYLHAYRLTGRDTSSVSIQKYFSETAEIITWIAIGY